MDSLLRPFLRKFVPAAVPPRGVPPLCRSRGLSGNIRAEGSRGDPRVALPDILAACRGRDPVPPRAARRPRGRPVAPERDFALAAIPHPDYTPPLVTPGQVNLVFSLTPRLLWLLLLVTLFASQTGCVRRRMTIRSNPPGALVYVDERRIGFTPVSTPFTYYGVRDVQLVKDGFETVNEQHRVAAPWYQYPVVDFISENLWPFEIRDERLIDFELQPQQAIPPSQVLQRAEQLRGDAQQGLMTPLPN